jgi:quinone-modifying oxidoreductase subunit QmoC
MAVGEIPVIVVSDPEVVETMLGLGAETLRRCYQCGTCSVVCPRTPLQDAFPRKEMVWAQWGLENRLLTDADAWLCYQCNDCITHCPVDARPGDVMAATRDLQIAHYASPRFMARIPTEARLLPLALAIPAVLVGLLVLVAQVIDKGGFHFPQGRILFEHFLGHGWIDVFALTLVAVVLGLSFRGLRRFWSAISDDGPPDEQRLPLLPSLRGALAEVFSHEGFKDCGTSRPRLWAHLAIFYGFLGLVAATTGAALYTEVLPAIGVHHHGGVLSLPIWDPVKVVGNVGGAALLIALFQAGSMRQRHPEKSGKSAYSDWFFVGLLALTALTGFATEILRYADARTAAYMAYLVHLVFVFGLFAYFPFSKFAHVLYRTAATVYARQVGRRVDRGAWQGYDKT